MKRFCVKDCECFLLFPGDTPENIKSKRNMYGEAHYFPSVTDTNAANCVVYDKKGDTCYGAILVTYDPWEATLTLDMENLTELAHNEAPLLLVDKIITVFTSLCSKHRVTHVNKTILHHPTITDKQKELLTKHLHYQERPGQEDVLFVHADPANNSTEFAYIAIMVCVIWMFYTLT